MVLIELSTISICMFSISHGKGREKLLKKEIDIQGS